ncbi:hypothetical protein EGN69_03345 [Pseudomonas monteilii]|nr:hypothetical protein EGN69_03345 [Pseudomonas monteilii]TFW23217.1 hypothetical protein E4L40_13485 [Pseudomonas putida]
MYLLFRLKLGAVFVGAGLPAKQATRCMAPVAPVFEGEPAPTGGALTVGFCASQSNQPDLRHTL